MWYHMVDRLTEDEMRRIQNFARTPAYARKPEQLLPEGVDPDGADAESEDREEVPSPLPDGGRHR